MTREAARMGKWMLSAAPVTLAAFRFFSAGGAGPALYAWAALGTLIPMRDQYPYVRKRRGGAHRLFFACSAGWLTMACAEILLRRFLPGTPAAELAAQAGTVFFALSLAAALLRLRIPRMAAWCAGGLFCMAAAYAAWALP